VRRSLLLLGLLLTAAVAAIVISLSGGSGQHPPRDDAGPSLAPASVGASIHLGGNPVAVAVGSGTVWVLDGARQTLSAIDPRTHRRRWRPAPVGGGPFAVAVGEGAVWVASGDGSIRAFDLRTGRPAGLTAHVRGANGLAAGADGIWVTSRLARTVTRIDPRTRRPGRPIRVGAGPADVAVGAGSVWVANADGGSVTRVDARTGRADAAIPIGGQHVLGLAVGEGGVWVARATGADADHIQIVRVDPRDRNVVGDPIAVTGAVPLDIAAAGGSVWVTDVGGLRTSGRQGIGHVTRLDPRRHEIVRPLLRAGQHPSAVAVGAGVAWIADGDDGTLTPIVVRPTR